MEGPPPSDPSILESGVKEEADLPPVVEMPASQVMPPPSTITTASYAPPTLIKSAPAPPVVSKRGSRRRHRVRISPDSRTETGPITTSTLTDRTYSAETSGGGRTGTAPDIGGFEEAGIGVCRLRLRGLGSGDGRRAPEVHGCH